MNGTAFLAQQYSPSDGQTLYLNVKNLTFWIVFLFVYVLAGPLTLLDAPFRLSPVALLTIPLFLRYGVKKDLIFYLYMCLFLVVAFSGWVNNSSVSQIVIFTRTLIVSYLVYWLVDVYLTKNTSAGLMRLCIGVGIVQVPLIVLQRLFYDWIPAAISGRIIYEDIGIGTFRDDSSLTFFLLLLVIVLLFAPYAKQITQHRILVVVVFSAGIFLANSDILKLTYLIIWTVYVLRNLNLKTVVFSFFLFTSIITILYTSGIAQDTYEKISSRLIAVVTEAHDTKSYLEGKYARSAALYYYLNRDILWIGDGPAQHTDPISRVRSRGNTGHIFTFYSEVGFLGWGLSVLTFLVITIYSKGKIVISSVLTLSFLSLQILSFTTEVMNHLGVVFIYCIVVCVEKMRPSFPTVVREKEDRSNAGYSNT